MASVELKSVELSDQEWQQVINILATTKDHPWVVTNPLLTKMGQQLQAQSPAPRIPDERPVRLGGDGREIRS